MIMDRYWLTRFACGHVGRHNESTSERRKVSAFLRVAQVGNSPVTESVKSCPECAR